MRKNSLFVLILLLVFGTARGQVKKQLLIKYANYVDPLIGTGFHRDGIGVRVITLGGKLSIEMNSNKK